MIFNLIVEALHTNGVPKTERLGETQRMALLSISRSPYPEGGWHLGGRSQTERTLDSLAKRGLVTRVKVEEFPASYGRPAIMRPGYRATPAVLVAAGQAQAENDRQSAAQTVARVTARAGSAAALAARKRDVEQALQTAFARNELDEERRDELVAWIAGIKR